MKRKLYLSFIYILKSYPAYDKSFFYKKMKPYLEGKNIQYLSGEDWVKESKEHKKRLEELLKIEKYNFFVTCVGDHRVYENTYGYPYQF